MHFSYTLLTSGKTNVVVECREQRLEISNTEFPPFQLFIYHKYAFTPDSVAYPYLSISKVMKFTLCIFDFEAALKHVNAHKVPDDLKYAL